ncbi:hypothetical protein [Parabacteroides gordonii]|uniref:hypothetical protein n=1 Tax=Parabacteroides gordonii TaxID=574930 RepID=UPI0026EFB8D2|nr:hypothetical protein [Parabacteroides gordonii]
MKHSHLLKIRSAAAALCAAVLLCACTNELRNVYEEEDSEFTTVTLQVGSAASQTKALTPDQEGAINSLYILAFQPDPDDGGTYKLKYKVTGTGDISVPGKFSFTLRTTLSGQPDTKLLLVANENPNVRAKEGKTVEEVQADLISDMTTQPAFAGSGIPMFGFAGDNPNTPLTIEKNKLYSANLLRAVARVDVGVGQYNADNDRWPGSADFQLTHVYVYKPQNKYTLIPFLDNLKYSNIGTPSVTRPSMAETGDWGAKRFEYTGGTIANNACKAEIYIPEVDFDGGHVYDINHTKRTALVIGGIYNGKTYYYRIDFTPNQTNTEGDDLNDVLRNTLYRFSITKVTQNGYDDPGKAYEGKPVGLKFTADINKWVPGGRPPGLSPELWVRMVFKGVNGTIIEGKMTQNEESGLSPIVILPKKNFFVADNDIKREGALDYNRFRGEAADNTYNGVTNGGTYGTVANALDREGPYKELIIAPDNASDGIEWRSTDPRPLNKRILDAKQKCWDYRAQGRSDWRLPRLSEVCLIWLNRGTINQSKGFTPLGSANETYWTGSEDKKDQAYSVNAAGEIKAMPKKTRLSVRCVREVR